MGEGDLQTEPLLRETLSSKLVHHKGSLSVEFSTLTDDQLTSWNVCDPGVPVLVLGPDGIH